MSGFYQYAILDPIQYHFQQEPKFWWKIKPVDGAADLHMSKFMARKRTKYLDDGSVEESYVTGKEVMIEEIALTFHSTNLPKDPAKPLEDGGQVLIGDSDPLEVVRAVLLRLPDAMLREIWSAVGTANPGWGPAADPKAPPASPAAEIPH